MKVAITGISGYLGQLIARKLQSDPAVDSILGLDLVGPSFHFTKMSFEYADVRSADFEKLLEGIDAVYHLAFVVTAPKDLTMAQIDRINIDGSRRVFEGAIRAGVNKIVYSSSIAAYGAHWDNPAQITEDSALRPNKNWYYSRTKGEVELILDELQKKHPETIVIRFRPGIFIGPTSNNQLKNLISARWLICLTKGLAFGLSWDSDVCDAFHLALNHGQSDIFNLAGDGTLTIEKISALIDKKILHLKLDWLLPLAKLAAYLHLIAPGQVDWLNVGMRYPINVSAARAKEKLGWQPRFDSTQALLEYCSCLGLIDN
ncbi:MAG: NAD-dependent epimerase/dehydratase family protein [Deltaproteobacteria bacterium]|nr:NAD-dependent epimerase/dehydratase family protein [Deltaproteobacteria bacterium]